MTCSLSRLYLKKTNRKYIMQIKMVAFERLRYLVLAQIATQSYQENNIVVKQMNELYR